jgi:predicted dehydrogenase
MLDDPDLTVLDDCAPPNLHAEPCIAAAEQGKAIICEKPLARTADEAYSIYRAVAKTGQTHMTAFNKRFVPAVQFARELIREGRLRRVHHVVATCYNIEYAGGFADPNYPLTWMFRKETAGHGALSDIGSHIIDMMRFTVGDIQAVCGATQTFVESRPLPEQSEKKGKVEVEDLSVACVRFANGAIGTLNVSWMPVGTRDYVTLEIYGSKGSLRFNFERPNEIELFTSTGDTPAEGFRTVICNSRNHPLASRFWPDQGSSYGFEQSFISEIAHFASSVEEGVSVEPLGASFYDGYMTCLLIDELVASARDGRWRSLEPQPRL